MSKKAATGSGKTIAFLVPIINLLLKKYNKKKLENNKILGLIISPTRELAKQIYEVCKSLMTNLHNHAFSLNLFIGGMAKEQNFESYKENGANILIGTPGKLREIFTCNLFKEVLDIKDLEMLVLGLFNYLCEGVK